MSEELFGKVYVDANISAVLKGLLVKRGTDAISAIDNDLAAKVAEKLNTYTADEFIGLILWI